MSDTKTFQWSMFLNGKDEQVVVRGNEWADFVLDIQKVRKEFQKEELLEKAINRAKELSEEDFEEELEEQDFCNIHKTKMKEREGKFGTFYSHYLGTYPNGSWCNGVEK